MPAAGATGAATARGLSQRASSSRGNHHASCKVDKPSGGKTARGKISYGRVEEEPLPPVVPEPIVLDPTELPELLDPMPAEPEEPDMPEEPDAPELPEVPEEPDEPDMPEPPEEPVEPPEGLVEDDEEPLPEAPASSVFLPQAPSASKAASATLTAATGLILDPYISIPFKDEVGCDISQISNLGSAVFPCMRRRLRQV